MPNFLFTFRNASDGGQDWNVQTVFDDTLNAGESIDVAAEVNETLDVGVAVSTVAEPTRFAAGTLSYDNGTGIWAFASHTPAEFAFNYNAYTRRAELSCYLRVE